MKYFNICLHISWYHSPVLFDWCNFFPLDMAWFLFHPVSGLTFLWVKCFYQNFKKELRKSWRTLVRLDISLTFCQFEPMSDRTNVLDPPPTHHRNSTLAFKSLRLTFIDLNVISNNKHGHNNDINNNNNNSNKINNNNNSGLKRCRLNFISNN